MIPYILFIFGLVIGSFLNVCIYRLPREESVVFPPSACPACKHNLRWTDLFPLFSYLLLRGKCRYCQASISWRYPLVELLTALMFVWAGAFFSGPLAILTTLVFVSVLIIIFFADLENFIVPDEAIIVGSVVAIISALLNHSVFASLLGAAIGGGFFLFITLLGSFVYKKKVMGFGDVKLALMLGLFLGGAAPIIIALYLAFIIGSIIGIFLIVTKIKSKADFIPFAPSIILGALPVYFFVEPLHKWWLAFWHLG